MTALFHPLHFTAHAGFVCFQGRPLSEFTATRVGVAIRKAFFAASDERLHAEADAMERAHDQLVKAIDDAKVQRRLRAA